MTLWCLPGLEVPSKFIPAAQHKLGSFRWSRLSSHKIWKQNSKLVKRTQMKLLWNYVQSLLNWWHKQICKNLDYPYFIFYNFKFSFTFMPRLKFLAHSLQILGWGWQFTSPVCLMKVLEKPKRTRINTAIFCWYFFLKKLQLSHM